MGLPAEYVKQMRDLLGEEEFAVFLASYDEPKVTAIRLNGLKALDEGGQNGGAAAYVSGREPVPWAEGAYYTNEGERPGKHPYYYAGLYYIQEPSAMLPAALLAPEPGDRVLDLCAAPGGKSTQLAAGMGGAGLLVSNDLATDRTKALAKNIERAGIRNAVVTNEAPAKLAAAFGATFDRVLVDAPCSGEGMFRKDEDMMSQWDKGTPARYAAMQDEIMREAAKLVAPGGRLVYSTCTFSPIENEGTIARFLAAHEEFEVVAADFPAAWGFAPGRPDWLTPAEAKALGPGRAAQLARTLRLWPHRVRGEGHFAALLARSGRTDAAMKRERPDELAGRAGRDGHSLREGAQAGDRPRGGAEGKERVTLGKRGDSGKFGSGKSGGKPGRAGAGAGGGGGGGESAAEAFFNAFVRDSLPGWTPPGGIRIKGDYVYVSPGSAEELRGLRLVREGWLLGKATRHRFEPSQALAMGLLPEQAALCLRLRGGEEEAWRYLRGETLQPEPERICGPDGRPAAGRGWTLVCLDDYPLGWGRWDGTLLKNELLPGWRQI